MPFPEPRAEREARVNQMEHTGDIIDRLGAELNLTRGPRETDWSFRQRMRTMVAAAPVDWNALIDKLSKITSPKAIAWLERWRRK